VERELKKGVMAGQGLGEKKRGGRAIGKEGRRVFSETYLANNRDLNVCRPVGLG